MTVYIIDKKLSSTTEQKLTSGALAIAIAAALIFLLWFVKIVIPNPPFETKQGVVEVDLGLVDAGYGSPEQGGPSPTPPALGGATSDGGSSTPSGGEGKIITSEGEKTVNLPPIDPPSSTSASEDPALKGKLGKIGNRKGKNAGDPNGINGGTGNKGWGPGPGNTGITGNHGKRVGGNGLYGYDFTNYKLTSDLRRVNADGQGTIVCRVQVDCGGNWSVTEYGSRGTTYNGSVGGLQSVVTTFLRSSHFEKVGEKCPESGLIYIEVKSKI